MPLKWHESVIVLADMTLDLIFVHHTCSWKETTNQKTHFCSCFCQTEQIDNITLPGGTCHFLRNDKPAIQ